MSEFIESLGPILRETNFRHSESSVCNFSRQLKAGAVAAPVAKLLTQREIKRGQPEI
jgi:hypothetical protein